MKMSPNNSGTWYNLKSWLDAHQKEHPEFDSSISEQRLNNRGFNYVFCVSGKVVFTDKMDVNYPINLEHGGQYVIYEVSILTSSSEETYIESFLQPSLTVHYFTDPLCDQAHQKMSAVVDEIYGPQTQEIIDNYNKPWNNTIKEGTVKYIGIGVKIKEDELVPS